MRLPGEQAVRRGRGNERAARQTASWSSHAALLDRACHSAGAWRWRAWATQVTLAYLPYANWQKPINRFDLRRQNAYARKVSGAGRAR